MRIVTLLLALVWLTPTFAKPITQEQVPEPLKPWVEWVKLKHPDLDCPLQYDGDRRNCVWPGELSIAAHKAGATFTQTLSVYRESRVPLPGGGDYWPANVRINGKPVAVVEEQKSPLLLLQPGEYRLEGEFHWKRLPDALKVDPQTGIVRYRLNGKEVRHPQLRRGKLWLQAGEQQSDKAPEDHLSMEIYRLLSDGHPFQVTTELNLEVSGSQREVFLGTPLLDGFIPLQLNSPLPARIESGGRLRVQVRPGSWKLRLVSRYPSELSSLTMPAQESPWPAQEVWVFRAAHQDRLTEVEGIDQIDPRQVRLPGEWTNLPTYSMTPKSEFRLKTVRRGDPDPEPDQLSLQRDLWLDFSGQGYTLRDRIEGEMTRDWRLSVDKELALGRVTVDEQPQFITRLQEDGREGVEVRRGRLKLLAESRYRGDVSDLPAIGWGRELQRVSADLHMPPGWRLFAVTGVDNVPSSWIQQWTLFDLFIVLLVTLTVGKLWGWKWSPLALLTLALTWHEADAPQMVWIYLLATIALLRAIPVKNRFYRVILNAQRLGFLALLIIALPFMVQQAREALYPQLEQLWISPQNFALAPEVSTLDEEMHFQAEGAMVGAPEPAAPMEEKVRPKRKALMRSYGSYASYPDQQAINQFDPTANILTGPGLPNWEWRSARLQWNGPVAADQRIGLYFITPAMQLVLNFLTIGLLAALAWRLIDRGTLAGIKPDQGQLPLLLLLIPLLSVTPEGMAAEFPPPELLQELEQRLIENPTAAPRASLDDLTIHAQGHDYRASFQVQALQQTAVPLPIDTLRTTPVRVRIDRQDANAHLYRTQQSQLWLLVPAGVHQVELEALLPAVVQLQIPLPLKPHRITLDINGWSVEGVNREGVPDRQLSLTRIRDGKDSATEELTPTTLPPFLQVERTLHFGINWEAETRVRRISPPDSSLSAKIPLLPGASVVTEGLRVKEGQVLVNMTPGQREVAWRSRLDPVDALTLTAMDDPSLLETWRADIGPIWHVTIDGIPPVHHQDAGSNWLPAWHPWPGEQVSFQVRRPEGVEGSTITIDESKLTVKPGKRATDATLGFSLRASQGGTYDLQLPPEVTLQSVKIDGSTRPIRQDGRLVSLPVVPGKQQYEIKWREMAGITAAWKSPELKLSGGSVNAKLSVTLPRDRWTLWVNGPKLGPAVLFWGVLLVLALAAAVLARAGSAYLPLGYVSWLLLGIGLSQVSVLSGILVVGWFFLLHYRYDMGSADNSVEIQKWRFNLTQIGLVLLTFAVLTILLWVVQRGLLGTPRMQIQGYGSSAYLMNWYQDRVGGDYPQASVLSVPLWIYRGLMLAWALWLAFSLLKWLKWGWSAFSKGGLWRSIDLSIGIGRSSK